MVNPALLASVDALDADELDELIEYAASKRTGVTEEQRAIVESRRQDSEPANWLTDDEFDARLDAMLS